jgi:hemolysin activation/secretion protein
MSIQAPTTNSVDLKIEQANSSNLPLTSAFLVRSIQLTGNRLIDTATLLALVDSAKGKHLTLSELSKFAALITAYYRSHDFPLARAIIPPQTIALGVVRIEVIEAGYGQIRLNNSSKVTDALLQSTLSQLQSGDAISQTNMEHVLLLLSDVPGVLVDATLTPGDAKGSSDFVVTTTHGTSAYGSMMLDSYGNRYTGRERIGGALNVLNLLHQGDTLSVNALSSGHGMNYARLGYEFLVNGRGMRLGGAHSALDYVLGAPYPGISGTAQVSSLWLKHPLIRSRETNINGQIEHDRLTLRDYYSNAIQTNRSLSKWTLGLNGDARNEWLAGGINSWNLGWSTGRVAFDNAAAQLYDASTANSQGSFSKWNANFIRLQALTPAASLHLTAAGQWAGKNLDSSQKMSAGGPHTVRAYDMGVLSGDNGYFLSAEYRHKLPGNYVGQWQLAAFVDRAHVTFNSNAWPAVTGASSSTLNGAGVGINWNAPEQWSLKASLATPIGSKPALVGSTRSTRAWVELVRRY